MHRGNGGARRRSGGTGRVQRDSELAVPPAPDPRLPLPRSPPGPAPPCRLSPPRQRDLPSDRAPAPAAPARPPAPPSPAWTSFVSPPSRQLSFLQSRSPPSPDRPGQSRPRPPPPGGSRWVPPRRASLGVLPGTLRASPPPISPAQVSPAGSSRAGQVCWRRTLSAGPDKQKRIPQSKVGARLVPHPGSDQDQAEDGLPAALPFTSAHRGLSTHTFLNSQPALPPCPCFPPPGIPAVQQELTAQCTPGQDPESRQVCGSRAPVLPFQHLRRQELCRMCPRARLTRTTPTCFQFLFPGRLSSTQKITPLPTQKEKAFPQEGRDHTDSLAVSHLLQPRCRPRAVQGNGIPDPAQPHQVLSPSHSLVSPCLCPRQGPGQGLHPRVTAQP